MLPARWGSLQPYSPLAVALGTPGLPTLPLSHQRLPLTTTRCMGNQETSSQSPQTDPDQGWKRKARGHAGKRHALLGEDIIDILQQLLKSETLSSVRQRLESACRQTRVTKPLVIYIYTHNTFLARIWDLQSPNKTNTPPRLRERSCSQRKSRHKVKTKPATERSIPCQADRCFERLCQFMSY